MNHACRETVVAALALHLNVDPLAIEISQRLESDWGLDALDIALLSLRLEELLDVEIPLSTLDEVSTVADLVTLTQIAAVGAEDELGLAMAQNSLQARIRRRRGRRRRESSFADEAIDGLQQGRQAMRAMHPRHEHCARLHVEPYRCDEEGTRARPAYDGDRRLRGRRRGSGARVHAVFATPMIGVRSPSAAWRCAPRPGPSPASQT